MIINYFKDFFSYNFDINKNISLFKKYGESNINVDESMKIETKG